MTIVACLKWLAHPDAPDDDRFAGVSPADQAALELALQLGAQRGEPVVVLSAAPAGAERALRHAIACGAAEAVRVDLAPDADSAAVAEALADAIAEVTTRTASPADPAHPAHPAHPASIVLCGDYSLDRGTGSVPAFLAHHLTAAQALGLVVVHPAAGPIAAGRVDAVRVTRRLDGGRREVLDVPTPCVLSVEGSVASLRRAPLRRLLEVSAAPVRVVRPGSHASTHLAPAAIITPYRPRARALPAPNGADPLDRLRTLTDASGSGSSRGEVVELDPAAAAARIVQTLREWDYLP